MGWRIDGEMRRKRIDQSRGCFDAIHSMQKEQGAPGAFDDHFEGDALDDMGRRRIDQVRSAFEDKHFSTWANQTC
jgi:hypothetical protein